MGHKDLGVRNYNPSLAAQQTKTGKSYLAKIRKMEPYERLLYWIKERHKVHTTRFPDGFRVCIGDDDNPLPVNCVAEKCSPWTDDPILQTVFFCNPYRENDKVTAYLRDNFREPNKDDKAVFIGTILLRWYNFIPTMHRLINANVPQRLGGTPAQCAKVLDQSTKMLVSLRDEQQEQLFGGAYIIRPIVDGKTGARKVESIAELMLSMIKVKTLYDEMLGNSPYQIDLNSRQFERLGSTTDGTDPVSQSPCTPGTMAYAFARLQSFSGMGKFYCYQFIGDLAYTHVLRDAPDWFTWGFCGPGTSRGLVRLKCPSGKATLPSGARLPRLMPLQRGWQEQLLDLQKQVNKDLKCAVPKTNQQLQKLKAGGEVRDIQWIHMRDLCNCLCEYDKYERALFNERSIKRPYAGT